MHELSLQQLAAGRRAELVRDARRHELAALAPRQRRQTLGPLGRLLTAARSTRQPSDVPSRTFLIAASKAR